MRPDGRAVLAAALFVTAGVACGGGAPGRRGGDPDPLAEVRALVEQRRFDEAIARVGEADDAESLYLLGRAWAGRAESAPVPTPEPGQEAAGGALLKPEERTALQLYERAVAARPDHAAAHLAIAQLLAPHALAAAAAPKGRTRTGATDAETIADRVLRSFGNAVQADPAGTRAVEEMIAFATRSGRVKEADAAYQELVRRKREDPDPLVRYGDFLAGPAADPERALAQYAQALIWRPDDAATKLKMADIHLGAAATLLGQQQYSAAEARLQEARRYVVDPGSPQAARLRELEGRIREIRGR